MKNFKVQVRLGSSFADLSVKASSEESAVATAKAKVAKTASLAIFRHRYANFVI